MHTKDMIATHPDLKGQVSQALVDAIDATYECAQSCNSCADACLAEEMVADLRQCIRFNVDCADVCLATATLGSRRTGRNDEIFRKLLDACIVACRLCGDECQRHASMHEHCRVCAESCQRCQRACEAALQSLQ